MEIEMLLNYKNTESDSQRNKWINNEFKFEYFIIDSMIKAKKFCENTLNILIEENSIELIENLLRPRIYAYVIEPVSII